MALSGVLYFAAIDFAVQWSLWFLSAILHTEKFYDLAGSSTFILLALLSYSQCTVVHPRISIQTSAVVIWALRLGSYLFSRILKDGQDRRFDKARDSPAILFRFWTMQGIWVILSLLPTLLMTLEKRQKNICFQDWLGWTLWLIGFLTEVLADYQKASFRSNPANKGKFIHTGVWSLSRHPNYFGEILLWFGLFVSASSNFTSWWQYLSILSPTCIYLLITKLSGIPPLENYGLKKWGDQPEYQAYLKNTPVLIPSIF